MAPSKTCLKSAKNQVGNIDPHKAFDEKGLDQHDGCSNDSFWEDFFPKGRILCQMRLPLSLASFWTHTIAGGFPRDQQGENAFLHKFFATTLLELHFGTLRFP